MAFVKNLEASRLKASDGKNRNKCALDGERGKRIEATRRIRIDSEFMIREEGVALRGN